jgi:hypothetical protein
MCHAGIDDLAAGHCADGINDRPKVRQHHSVGLGINPNGGVSALVRSEIVVSYRSMLSQISRPFG